MTKLILAAAALSAAIAAPAAAQTVQVVPGAAGAIAHFNQSREQGERLIVPRTERQRASRPSRSFEIARQIVNGSADGQDGKILGRGTRFD
ncbi:hypothetical protein JQC91_10180 [Jannaschia sp. Os4]|uniref:hypothetical protein n=1 Tax=Jannaschia sp. Os4 TaxID=2807617 RepID=UPI00193A855B|nr:hypothetical protein [Jannaschia sp. Os4]MBM2576671.1 hypothetical protein [Jannaschia sp. Os4]